MTFPIKDIKKHYFILCETGLILALLIMLSAFNIETGTKTTYEPSTDDKDVITIWDRPITDQTKKPIPVKPKVKAQKPEDVIIDDPIDDLEIKNISDPSIEKLPEIPPQKKRDEEEIFVEVQQFPSIIGGYKSLYDNITYPKRAKAAGIEGVVYIEFIVNKDGSVSDAKVKRGIGGGCDEEALESVKKLEFIPGRQRGNAVRVRMRLPVRFDLKN